jgi:hypothetical protein
LERLAAHAHEPGGEVVLVELARRGPLLGEAARGAVHPVLALEQLAVRLVEHRDHQLVLAAEVVVDERVVDAGVAADLAHAERGVALRDQAAERRLEDLALGLAEVGLGEQAGRGFIHVV